MPTVVKLSVAFFIVMLNVTMVNDVMLSVVAPFGPLRYLATFQYKVLQQNKIMNKI